MPKDSSSAHKGANGQLAPPRYPAYSDPGLGIFHGGLGRGPPFETPLARHGLEGVAEK
jgi:hypothetical protein